jgi:hypothetical protein
VLVTEIVVSVCKNVRVLAYVVDSAVVVVVVEVVDVSVMVTGYVVDVPVVVVAYVVDVAVVVVVVVVASAGPIAGAFVGTRTTSATRIMQTITRILIASCLFKSIPSRCWA